jgi:hypothetical protein
VEGFVIRGKPAHPTKGNVSGISPPSNSASIDVEAIPGRRRAWRTHFACL